MAEAERKVYIYALCDPRTHEVRYIGSAFSPWTRFREHYTARCAQDCSKARWIRDLVQSGVDPELLVIDVVEASGRRSREELWLVNFLSIGQALTNYIPKALHERVPSGKRSAFVQAALREKLAMEERTEQI